MGELSLKRRRIRAELRWCRRRDRRRAEGESRRGRKYDNTKGGGSQRGGDLAVAGTAGSETRAEQDRVEETWRSRGRRGRRPARTRPGGGDLAVAGTAATVRVPETLAEQRVGGG